ncbi:Dual specificity phosphatase [Pelomyxa schiedti]|nr:Dual specificity phosphatase [Pelomyxa schiedti]
MKHRFRNQTKPTRIRDDTMASTSGTSGAAVVVDVPQWLSACSGGDGCEGIVGAGTVSGTLVYNSVVCTTAIAIDIRPRTEFWKGHICASLCVPLGELPDGPITHDDLSRVAKKRPALSSLVRRGIIIIGDAPTLSTEHLSRLKFLLEYLTQHPSVTGIKFAKDGFLQLATQYPSICKPTPKSEIPSESLPLEPLHLNFIDVRISNLPCEIIPGFLFLGGCDAVSKDILNSLGITHVVNMCAELTVPLQQFPTTKFLHCPIDDFADSPLEPSLSKSLEFIDSAFAEGKKVLVHCAMGISRSSSVVIGYLIHHSRMTFDAAHAHVKQCRPFIQPNPGFVKQLIKFQASLGIS